MFGVNYVKASPTTYVMHYKRGKVMREGAGLSFFYFGPSSTLVMVSLASRDLPFAFSEQSNDFQALTVQGQLTFRVVQPTRLAALLDHAVDSNGRYRGDDPDSLAERLTAVTQVHIRAVVGQLPLRGALRAGDTLVDQVLGTLQKSDVVQGLGVEVMGLSISSLAPAPEMARALEAEARESLQRQSDEAIYARRRAAVEQERVIKETELNTEIAVEEKKRTIRETQMAADVSVEQQRGALIDRRVENERKDADSRAYALEATLKPVKDVDWRTLLAVGGGGNDPRMMIALAFRELAENAQKIGSLNVTPDLLQALLAPGGKKP
ncbi:MAG: SPFH domain-containing protein [Deltaproteobacteria bacterium]|nr:SPFH domain-containing protein [Deltaproteobacteria bacterium]